MCGRLAQCSGSKYYVELVAPHDDAGAFASLGIARNGIALIALDAFERSQINDFVSGHGSLYGAVARGAIGHKVEVQFGSHAGFKACQLHGARSSTSRKRGFALRGVGNLAETARLRGVGYGHFGTHHGRAMLCEGGLEGNARSDEGKNGEAGFGDCGVQFHCDCFL